MKTTQKTTKILSTVAALMLFSAVEAYAGSVILDGYVDYIEAAGATGVTYDSPVSLELTWTNDSLVPAEGQNIVVFRPDWGNTMTFTVGGLTLKDTPFYGNPNPPPAPPPATLLQELAQKYYPAAHFTDGVLDGFVLNYYDASITGVAGNSWIISAIGIVPDDNGIFWQIIDDGSSTGAWIEGYLDFPTGSGGPSPVPVPAAAWLLGSGLAGLMSIRRKLK